jgi:hypothetical protein
VTNLFCIQNFLSKPIVHYQIIIDGVTLHLAATIIDAMRAYEPDLLKLKEKAGPA